MGSKYYVNPDTGQRVYIKDKIPSLAQYRKAADQDEIDEEIRQDLVNKLTKPATVEVGKYLKISAVNADGSVVLENVDLPLATVSTTGIIRYHNEYGIQKLNDNNLVGIMKADESEIDNKIQEYRPIVPANLDYAVKKGLSDSQIDWSATEQLAARQRIGAQEKEAELVLLNTITVVAGETEYDLTATDNNVPFNIKSLRVYCENLLPDSTSVSRLLTIYAYNSDAVFCGGTYNDTWKSTPYIIVDVYPFRGFWESTKHTATSAGAWNSVCYLPKISARMLRVNNKYINNIKIKSATTGSSFASGKIYIYGVQA